MPRRTSIRRAGWRALILSGRSRPGTRVLVAIVMVHHTGLLGEEAGGLWQRIPAERKRLRRKV
eukprot:439013-Prymnesium_polylepis.1